MEFRMPVLIDITQIVQLPPSLLPTQGSKLLSSLAGDNNSLLISLQASSFLLLQSILQSSFQSANTITSILSKTLHWFPISLWERDKNKSSTCSIRLCRLPVSISLFSSQTQPIHAPARHDFFRCVKSHVPSHPRLIV